MANNNAPYGLRPSRKLGGGCVANGGYSIASGQAGAIYSGDVVMMTGTGKNIEIAPAGTTNAIGVFAGCYTPTYLLSNLCTDRDYIERNALGFEQLTEHVQPFNPEWAYLETGLEPELIRTTAREMAAKAPATLVHPGRHTTWYAAPS